MSLRVRELYLPLDHEPADVCVEAARVLGVGPEDVARCEPVRRAIDARHKGRIRFVYTVSVGLRNPAEEAPLARLVPHGHAYVELRETPPALEPGGEELAGPVVVIGAGPAGMFAALRLAEAGYAPLVIERGQAVEKRASEVAGDLVFGEGGAGAYTDGKLTHRAGSREAATVLSVLAECGAPADIVTEAKPQIIEAKPHIGSDVLPTVLANLGRRIERAGGSFCFGSRATGFVIEDGRLARVVMEAASGRETLTPGAVVLAPGLNARDTWRELLAAGVRLECRPSLIGLRVEHPQEIIDRAQYGEMAGHPRLGAADYFVKRRASGGLRPVHSFCMCPGGRVIAVASEPERLSTNGMSRRARDSGYANAALIAPVGPADYGGSFGSTEPLAGVEFIEKLERAAFKAGGGDYSLPCQGLRDFAKGRTSRGLPPAPPGTRRTLAEVGPLLPRAVAEAIKSAVKHFARQIEGFLSKDAAVYGAELRTGSPVRITRLGESGASVSAWNLYPAGEGAGYAGGIVSSAADGLRQAAKIVRRFARP